MTTSYAFDVSGTPKPQGSKRARIGPDGRIWMYEANSKLLKQWREAVTWEARRERGRGLALRGPVQLELVFHVKHPVKGAQRVWPVGVPDLDKLVRAVGDSITQAGLILDDSQIVDLHATKVYASKGGWTGVRVSVRELPPHMVGAYSVIRRGETP